MKQRQPLARPRRKRSVERLPTSIRLTDQLAAAIRDEAAFQGLSLWKAVAGVEPRLRAPGLRSGE